MDRRNNYLGRLQDSQSARHRWDGPSGRGCSHGHVGYCRLCVSPYASAYPYRCYPYYYPRSYYYYTWPYYSFGYSGLYYGYNHPYFTYPNTVFVYDDYDEPSSIAYETNYYGQPEGQVSYESTGGPSTVYVSPNPAPAQPMDSAPSEPGAVPPAPSDGGQGQEPSYPTLPGYESVALVREGSIAFTAGRYDEARQIFVRAVMADERDGVAKVMYGLSSFALRDYRSAAASVRRALLTTPDLIDYPIDVRPTYGDDRAVFEAQMTELSRHVDANPPDREAKFVLAFLLYSVGEAGRAASVFNGLVEADPSDELSKFLGDAATRAANGDSGKGN